MSGVEDTIRLEQVRLTATDNQGSTTFSSSVDSLPVCPSAHGLSKPAQMGSRRCTQHLPRTHGKSEQLLPRGWPPEMLQQAFQARQQRTEEDTECLLSAKYVLYLILMIIPCNKVDYPYFIDGTTRGLRYQVTCPRAHCYQAGASGRPGSRCCMPTALGNAEVNIPRLTCPLRSFRSHEGVEQGQLT